MIFISFSALPTHVDFIWFIKNPKEDSCRVFRNLVQQKTQQQQVPTVFQALGKVLGYQQYDLCPPSSSWDKEGGKLLKPLLLKLF